MDINWHDEAPPDAIAQTASELQDLLDGALEKAEDLVFHTVSLTADQSGPNVLIWGEKGDPAFHAEYFETVVVETVTDDEVDWESDPPGDPIGRDDDMENHVEFSVGDTVRACRKEEEWCCDGLQGTVIAVDTTPEGDAASYQVEFEHPMGGVFREWLAPHEVNAPPDVTDETWCPPPD